MLRELRKLTSEFGKTLTESVENRIESRRQMKLSTLLAYLINPSFLDGSNSFGRQLPYASKYAITKLATDLYIRLFVEEAQPSQDQSHQQENSNADQSQTESETGPPPPKKSRSNELRDFKATDLQHSTPRSYTSSSASIKRDIEYEMKSLEKFGRRQEKLEKVYQALMSIQVTSVESERSFSACGLLVTKLRTRDIMSLLREN